MLFVAALVSLVLSEWALSRYTSVSFYLLPTRGWELLIGALAAFYLLPYENDSNKSLNLSLHQTASLAGLALIIYCVFALDKFTPFPGVNALLPTIGAVLIILFANTKTTSASC